MNLKNLFCSENDNNELQNLKDPYDAWEVKNDDVTLSKELGQGAFGKVYQRNHENPFTKEEKFKIDNSCSCEDAARWVTKSYEMDGDSSRLGEITFLPCKELIMSGPSSTLSQVQN